MKLYNRIPLLLFAAFLLQSCSKEKASLPVLTTNTVTQITYKSATSGGEVTSESGAVVVSRGICWSTSPEPTITDSKTVVAGTMGFFTCDITTLSSNTIYYVRAFATNSAGTGYGDQVQFTTSPGTPVLSDFLINSFSVNTCSVQGAVLSQGGAAITDKGVCYSTAHNPTISDSKISNGTETGSSANIIAGLLSNTIYYFRAYATNSFGTQYGNELTIKTLEKISDIDGNTYNIASISGQIWMAENLKTTRYKDGTAIPNDVASWGNLSTPGYCWYNNNSAVYKDLYGALYNWYAVNTGNLCPAGWHIPSDPEFVTLIVASGGENLAGMRLKEAGTTHWNGPNMNATNESLFTALPAGEIYGTNGFSNAGSRTTFWSSTVYETENIYSMELAYNYQGANRFTNGKKTGASVRCIKN